LEDSNYPTPVGIPLGIAATAIIILSAIVFVKGRALSAILYPTPECIPLGITASAILILRRGSIRQWLSAFGVSLHWRLTSLETIVLETIVFEVSSVTRRHCLRTY